MQAKLNATYTLYREVFAGRSDRIPLIVTPPCPPPSPPPPSSSTMTGEEIEHALQTLQPKIEAGSDWIPSIGVLRYQCIVVPSFFGATPVVPPGSGPIVTPIFKTIGEAAAAGIPAMKGPILEEMMATLDTALRLLPEDLAFCFPATSSPFDLAQLMLPGEEFLVSLLTEPETALEFLNNLTELCIQVLELTHARLADSPSAYVTNRGLWFPGLRMASDAIVNFTPAAIREIALPILRRFGERFGKLCIHYCSKPAPSGHVLPELCRSEYVGAVDTWQGPDAFIGDNAPARMQSRVGLIFDVDLTTEKKMDAFLDWAPIRDVPRKNGRALVLHTSAPSLDDAKKIYTLWRAKT